MLARSVNVNYENFNSLYIISSSLVEQRFTGKQADQTAFGHIPSSINKMYYLWNHLFKNQLIAHPSLYKANASLISENDFKYIKDFNWAHNFWNKYLALPISDNYENEYF